MAEYFIFAQNESSYKGATCLSPLPKGSRRMGTARPLIRKEKGLMALGGGMKTIRMGKITSRDKMGIDKERN